MLADYSAKEVSVWLFFNFVVTNYNQAEALIHWPGQFGYGIGGLGDVIFG